MPGIPGSILGALPTLNILLYYLPHLFYGIPHIYASQCLDVVSDVILFIQFAGHFGLSVMNLDCFMPVSVWMWSVTCHFVHSVCWSLWPLSHESRLFYASQCLDVVSDMSFCSFSLLVTLASQS